MAEKIYGVDPESEFSTVDVRDAIIGCFVQAHGRVLEEGREAIKELSEEEFEKIKELNVEQLVRKLFDEIGVDYENPTKESLVKVCDRLREFAKNFRNQDMIRDNYNKIMKLVEKL
jgi:hypothetical protein